jgi:hypothetical protein
MPDLECGWFAALTDFPLDDCLVRVVPSGRDPGRGTGLRGRGVRAVSEEEESTSGYGIYVAFTKSSEAVEGELPVAPQVERIETAVEPCGWICQRLETEV